MRVLWICRRTLLQIQGKELKFLDSWLKARAATTDDTCLQDNQQQHLNAIVGLPSVENIPVYIYGIIGSLFHWQGFKFPAADWGIY